MAIKTQKLPVQLTEDQILERARAHAKLCQELAEMEEHAKEIAAEWKKMIKAKKVDEAYLRLVVNSGKETRDIEVKEEYEGSAGVVRTIRQDTGEIVHTRGMTPEELQDYRQCKLLPITGGKTETSDNEPKD